MRAGRREQYGDLVTRSGAITSNPSAPAGEDLNLIAGAGVTTGNGGAVSLTGGDSSGTTGNGGNINLDGGTSTSPGTFGGSILSAAGDGTVAGGSFILTTGNAISGPFGGTVSIVTGTGTGVSAQPGPIILQPSNTANDDGSIQIKPNSGTVTPHLRFYENFGGGGSYVALRAPVNLAGDVIWTLPDAAGTDEQVLSTDGTNNLSWQNTNSVYEAISGIAQVLSGVYLAVNFGTARFANTDFAVAAGIVTANRDGLYSIEYAISVDSTNGTRDAIVSEIFINGVAYPNSQSYSYHRTTGVGENTATKKVLAQLTATDTVEVRSRLLAGTGAITIAGQSNLIFERKGP